MQSSSSLQFFKLKQNTMYHLAKSIKRQCWSLLIYFLRIILLKLLFCKKFSNRTNYNLNFGSEAFVLLVISFVKQLSNFEQYAFKSVWKEHGLFINLSFTVNSKCCIIRIISKNRFNREYILQFNFFPYN